MEFDPKRFAPKNRENIISGSFNPFGVLESNICFSTNDMD